MLSPDLGYSLEDRLENVRRVTYLANILVQQGVVVLVAIISPLQQMRDSARSVVSSFVEVFVDAPLSICQLRDPKGLYGKARAGLLSGFTGIDAPYEPPLNPDLTCFTESETVDESSAKVIAIIVDRLHPRDPEVPSLECEPKARRKTIAVDFDGVIANYEGWCGRAVVGSPRADVLEALRQLRTEGWKVIIHTTRCKDDLLSFLNEFSVEYDEVNVNSDYQNLGAKPVATVYWDDRALRYSGNAFRDLMIIRGFKTWNGRS
jgi:adenylylsulfate kinase